LRSVLNSGFKQGGLVRRAEKSKDAGYKSTTFPVYGPKALAGIGIKSLDRVTLDRTFAISMVRKKKTEQRERLRRRLIEKDAALLAKKINGWAEANREAVGVAYDRASFPYLRQFNDRTIDISESLAAILEIAYKGNKELDKIRAMLVEAIRTTR